MTPPIDYVILNYDQKSTYYKYCAHKNYTVFKGISKIYNRFRHTILMKNGCVCEHCEQHGNNIHHKKPTNRYPNLYYCVDNIIVLCRKCHKSIHNEEGY